MFKNRQGDPKVSNTILRLPGVLSEAGISRSSLYVRIRDGLWTSPVALGLRMVGWPAREVHELNAARIAGKSDAEIRELVTSLLAARREQA
jgi:prophage regulatory protein